MLDTVTRSGNLIEREFLLNDRGSITGEVMFAPSSPLGRYRAVGTIFVLGHGAERCDAEFLENRLASTGSGAGFGSLRRMDRAFSRAISATPTEFRARFKAPGAPG